ncbi:MAG: SDR family oxidoreductase [Azospirillaceae bacterium]
MARIEGKVAVVTGASSGIGRAAAHLFAREGASVVVGARREAELASLVAEIEAAGGKACALAGDVQDEDFASGLTELAIERFGGLDIAFNNAGTLGEMAPGIDVSIAGWRETIDVNLTSAFVLARRQIPAMIERGGGSLIFTSSFVGVTAGIPGMTAYAASKAGLLGLVQTLAVEYGAVGIRVNALLPGGTDTAMNVARLPGAAPETQSFVEGLHALKRLAEPEEIAEAALFLASGQSSFVTGTALFADGGVSINKT